jgi:hypothetical protein
MAITTEMKYPNHVFDGRERVMGSANIWTYMDRVANNPVWDGATEGSSTSGHLGSVIYTYSTQWSDSLNGEDYRFNIPLNARIDGVLAKILRSGLYSKDVSVSLNGVSGGGNKAKNRQRTDNALIVDVYGGSTDKWGISNITPAIINSPDFGLGLCILRSIPGAETYVAYVLGLQVTYTEPTYSLTANIESSKVVGNNIVYTLTLTNTNNIHQGYDIPVSFSIPSGLSYVSQSGDGTYNPSTGKWNAILSNGSATLTLVLSTSSVGSKTVTATVDEYGTSISKTTNILPPNFTLNSKLPLYVVQNSNVTYDITVTTDSPTLASKEVNVPIPAGFTYVSSTGAGSYNSSTGVWTASFTNKEATRTFTFTAVTPGEYTQTISITGGPSLSKDIIIVSQGITKCCYSEYNLPDTVKNYLQHGKKYTISCYSKISDTSLTNVYPGLKNFKIAAIQTIDNLVSANVATGTNTLATIGGYTNWGTTLESSTEWAVNGWNRSLKVICPGTQSGERVWGVLTSAVVGETYTAQVKFKGAAGETFNISLQQLSEPYTIFSGGNGTKSVTATGQEQTITVSGVCPAGTTSAGILVRKNTISTNPFYIGEIIVVKGTTIPQGEIELLSGDIIVHEDLGTRVTTLDTIERISVSFTYDETNPIKIRMYGQYLEVSPSTATIRFFGFELQQGEITPYTEPIILFNNPRNLILDNNYAVINIPYNTKTTPIILRDINLSGRETDSTLIVKGIAISFDYEISTEIGAKIILTSGDNISIKSTILQPGGSNIVCGNSTDRWNLKNIEIGRFIFCIRINKSLIRSNSSEH